MQRRRLVPVAVLALLGGLALTGCRSQPNIAAYVGSYRITESRVDEMVKDGDTASRQYSNKFGLHAPSRSDVVTTLVLSQVCDQLRVQKGFTPQQITADQVQQAELVSAKSEYAKVRAHMWSCVMAIPASGSITPTDAELRDVYARAHAAGATDGASYEQFVAQVKDNPQVQQKLAAARQFSQVVRASDITVNPRYRPLEFPLLSLRSGESVIAVPLGEPGLDAVTSAH